MTSRARTEGGVIARIVACAAILGAVLTSGTVGAAEPAVSVGEVAPPPAVLGIDASVVRATATEEIRQIDVSRVPRRRRVVVSFAVTKAAAEATISCTINATLRDAKTGAIIAIIEVGTQASGPASTDARKQVASAAVRSAVRRIPRALGAP